MKPISIDDAHRILSDVMPEQCFWVNNGPIVRNLHEMETALAYMKSETLRHHVNKDKNDMANWVRDVLQDEELASGIAKTISKEKIVRLIRKRMKFLEKLIEKSVG